MKLSTIQFNCMRLAAEPPVGASVSAAVLWQQWAEQCWLCWWHALAWPQPSCCVGPATAILSYFLGTKNSKSRVFLIIHKLFMLQIIFSKIGFNNTSHDCLDVLCYARTMNFYLPVMPGDTNCIKHRHSTLQHCTKSEAGPPGRHHKL